MMMKSLLFILASLLSFQFAFSQEPNDCVNAVTVCGNGSFVSNVNGPGNDSNEISGCGAVYENNTFWIKIDIVQAGTLGFDLIPVSTDMQVDYDFWVFGPNTDCSSLGSSIRCNTNNPTAEGAPNNHTGINGSTTSTIAGPGNIGTPYVQWLNVLPGQTYYIAIDRFLGDEGFELQWTGTATQGSGAFAEPPTANEIPDYLTCSNNSNVGLFDLNTVRSDINPDLTNHTFTFYESYADAIDGINALPTLLTNSSNPQTVIAKVTNNITGCFSLTEFDLVVSGIPDVSMAVSQTSVCATEAVTITFSGTPGVTVNYEVNGIPEQAVLDGSGSFSLTDNLLVDTDYQIINAQVVNEIGDVICSNSSIADVQSVSVSSMQVPLVTSNSPICQNDTAEITVSGEPGAQVDFLLNGVSNSITLAADGTNLITIPNASNNIEIALQSVEQTSAPFCTQDITGNNYTVIVNSLPVYEEPVPKVQCDFNNPGDEQELFLLDAAEVLAGETGVSYTFHETSYNAINDIDALEGDPNNPNNEISYYNQTNPQTLYIRGEDDVTGCFTIMTLQLEVLPMPVATTPSNIDECDAFPNDGLAIFDLTEVESEILGIQNPNNYHITYYTSQADAELPGTPITTPEVYENSLVNGEDIYVRVEIVGNTQCYATTSFNINVLPSPDASFQMEANCDGATATILGDQGGTFSFTTVPTDSAIIDSVTGALSNVTSGTTYQVAYTVNLLGCIATETVSVTISTSPNINAPTSLQTCGIIANGVLFDLESKTSEITNNDNTLIVTYYTTQALAEAGNTLDALSSPYQITTSSQTIYVRVENASGCVVYTELTLEVFETTQVSQLPILLSCNTNNNGVAQFNLTEVETTIGFHPNWNISYHTTQAGAENGTGVINNPQLYNSSNATVYVLVTNTLDFNNLCDMVLPLQLEVNSQPLIFSDEIVVCEPETNGFEVFDLQTEIPNILGNSQNASNFDVIFYEDSMATNQITVNPYPNISAYTQTIYVQITDINTGCNTLFPFYLEVQAGVQVVPPVPMVVCDFLNDNDGIEQFDLTSVETDILNGQNPNLYHISYHISENEALNGTNPIENPDYFQNTTSPYAQTIYIRVEDLNTAANCIAVTHLDLEVVPVVEPVIYSDSNTLCVDYATNELLSTLTLSSSLQGSQYSYQWYLNGEAILNATSHTYFIDTVAPGNYSVVVTDTLSNMSCNSGESNNFEVIQSGPPNFVNVTTSQPFSSLQSIYVEVEGYGDYAYQLNNGPILNNEGVFYHVPAGVHSVTVYDVKTNTSCGSIVIEDIQIIDYPKFFTPNNDGDNDTWSINGFPYSESAKILIFDRYGKIITQIKPNTYGWDGTYNGNLMPSSDYWFLLTYTDEVGNDREFRAHFTLKR